MIVFSEKVQPTFTSSDHNVIIVKDYEEVFFDVFELEINGNKFVAERVSDHNGSPVVTIPIENDGKKYNIPFILEKGDKFEIYYNKDAQKTYKPVKASPKNNDTNILELVETKIQKKVPLFEVPDIEIDKYKNKEKSKLNDDRRQNIVSESYTITEGIKDQISEQYKVVFSEKVQPTFTSSDHNVIIVEDYNEIFFDVFELYINGNKFVAEKVSDYNGSPVITVPIEDSDKKYNVPCILEKGDRFELYYNKDAQKIYKPVKKSSKTKDINLLELVETKIQEKVPLFEVPDIEKAVDNIKSIKESAASYLEHMRLKYLDEQKREIDKYENKKKGEIKKLNDDYRQNMVSEFHNITESIKDQISKQNNKERDQYNDFINESFNQYCQELDQKIGEDYQSAIKLFESKIDILTDNIFAEKIQSIFESKVDDLEKTLSSKEALFKKEFSTSILELVEAKIQEKAPLFEIPDIEKVVDNIKSIKESAASHLDRMRLEYLDEQKREIDKYEKKKKSEIKRLRQNMVSEFRTITESIKNEISDQNNKERDQCNDFINESLNQYCDELDQKVGEDYQSAIKLFESKIDTLTDNIFAEKIQNIFESKVEDLEKILYSKEALFEKEFSTKFSDKFNKYSEEILENVESKSKTFNDRVKNLAERYENAITSLQESNIETNDLITKNTNRALSRIGNVKTILTNKIDEDLSKLQESTKEIESDLRTKLSKHKSYIKKYFGDKVSILETKFTDISEDYRDNIIDLIHKSEDKLLNEISKIDRELPTVILKEAKDNSGDNSEVSLEDIRKELENNISNKFSKEIVSLKRLIEMSSGGGSVAQQFANGGVINGDLVITGSVSASSFLGISGTSDTDLGTAASLDVGTTANNVVQLDASARLPAVDASQLINLPSGATQLSDLSDVNTSTATNRNVLIADGTDFESRTLVEADISDLGTYLTSITGESLASLSDVNTTGTQLDAIKTKVDGIEASADVTPAWVPSSDPSYATETYVDTEISNLVDSAPEALDTLNELAAALGDDDNFATTVTNNIATKLPLSGGTITGNIVMSGSETVDGRDLSVDGAKLDGIEASADVTDATNVAAAGALMDSEVTNLAQVKTFDSTDYAPALGADDNYVTDAEKIVIGNTSGTNTGDQDLSSYQLQPSEGAFVDGDKTKLNGIETGADVTDAANVAAAGALMDSEVTNLAQVKAFDSSDYAPALGADDNYVTDAEKTVIGNTSGTNTGDQDLSSYQLQPTEGAFVDGDKTKLDGIESGATADQTAAEIRALVDSATDSNVFTDADHTKLDGIESGADVTDTANVVSALTAGSNITIGGDGTISSTDTNTQLSDEEVQDIVGGMVTANTESGISVTYDDTDGTLDFSVASQTDENFTTADHTKLDGIESGADVTDTANVTAAGALMDSEVTNLDQVKAFDSSDYAPALGADDNYVTDAEKIVIGNTSGTNTGDQDLSSYQLQPSEGAFVDGDKTKLDGIEASADVTDAANVAAAGALMDSEVTNLAQVKAFDSSDYAPALGADDNYVTDAEKIVIGNTSGTNTGDQDLSAYQLQPSEGAFVDGDKTKLDGIEAGATADQTAAEIRTLVDSATDSNVFTDADHTKLDGIEAAADVTDTANVTSAGALMDSEVTNLEQVKAFDSSNYATSAQGALADSALQSTDIDTLAELNTIVTDATLIDTTDSRLSDSRACDNTFDNAATARANLGLGNVENTSDATKFNNLIGPQTLTSSTSVSWDCNSGRSAVLTMAHDVQLQVPTNLPDGHTASLSIIQDESGGRNLTLATGMSIMTGNLGDVGNMSSGGKAEVSVKRVGTDYRIFIVIAT